MLQGIHSRLRRLSPRARLALAVLLTGAVAVLDLTSGSDISFALLYLLPLGGLAWYNGERVARLLTAVCALSWLADGLVGAFHPGVAIWNTAIRTAFFLIIILLIGRLRQAYELQRTLAGHDSLTGLANFRTLSVALGQRLTPRRLDDGVLTVAYLDLDNFKQVNDRLGHAAGNTVLLMVADAIRSTLRADDLSARVGGDEFVVVLSDCDEPDARSVLERLRAAIQAYSDAEYLGISVSIGAICLAAYPEQVDTVLQRADAALYRAKSAGKNRIVIEARQEVAAPSGAHIAQGIGDEPPIAGSANR
jgi:diguanylate cyclase (GGDEF)-like protein